MGQTECTWFKKRFFFVRRLWTLSFIPYFNNFLHNLKITQMIQKDQHSRFAFLKYHLLNYFAILLIGYSCLQWRVFGPDFVSTLIITTICCNVFFWKMHSNKQTVNYDKLVWCVHYCINNKQPTVVFMHFFLPNSHCDNKVSSLRRRWHMVSLWEMRNYNWRWLSLWTKEMIPHRSYGLITGS